MNICTSLSVSVCSAGVFGVDTEDVKTVMEGDSLTLEANFTEIQTDGLIKWECNGTRIAKINKQTGKDEYSDKIMFSDRLNLAQTGYLTIWNIRIKHSGEYKVEGTSSKGTKSKTFRVIVKESPLKTVEDKDEIKTLSVTEGHSETLHTDTELQKHDLILWRFGAEGSLIAKGDLEDDITSYYDGPDGRFRDRLKINSKTGSLTITDIKTEHGGEYQLKIISDRKILFKRFTVTVFAVPDPGLSSGAVAGIVVVVVVGVLLVFSAAGVSYYRYKISEVERQMGSVKPKTVECEEGTFAVLPSGVNLVTKGDQIRWLSEDGKSPIATMSENHKKTYFYDNQRFRGRLQLDPQTGSLIIRNLRKTDSGLYHLEIKSRGATTYRKYKVTLSGEVQTETVKEGGDVTLKSGFPVQSVSHIMWSFEEENGFIASLTTQDNKTYKPEYSDKRFKDRLELDTQTGSLTIRNIRPEHTGLYEVKTNHSAFGIKAFSVVFDDSTETRVNESVNTGFMGRIQKWCGPARNRGLFRDETDEMKTVQMVDGGDLCLNPETEIQTDDEMILRFGTSFRTRRPYVTIARFSKTGVEFKSSGRFNDRLQLDHNGPLTITIKNFKITDYGDYYVQITSKKNKSFKSFTFIVVPRGDAVKVVSAVMGKPVCLKTDITDLHKDDQKLWTFGPHGMIIKNSTTSKCDSRFKDRVDLDHQTGSLTIKNITTADSGLYQLHIISGNRVRNLRFRVTVKEDEASASVQITDDGDQDEGDRIRAFWDERDEQEAQEATQFL